MSFFKFIYPTDWSWNELQEPFSLFSTFERIAKKILLAQIKANLSASDDMSWDDETQTDDSKSDGDQEVKDGNEEDNTPLEDGKWFFCLFTNVL